MAACCNDPLVLPIPLELREAICFVIYRGSGNNNWLKVRSNIGFSNQGLYDPEKPIHTICFDQHSLDDRRTKLDRLSHLNALLRKVVFILLGRIDIDGEHRLVAPSFHFSPEQQQAPAAKKKKNNGCFNFHDVRPTLEARSLMFGNASRARLPNTCIY